MDEQALVERIDRNATAPLVINFSQMHTFVALVEEGSVTRASQRLGLGHSTVSAHIKLIGEEFGQRQFNRFQNGLAFTPSGLQVYNRFRSLIARADFAMAYFRSGSVEPARYCAVVMPPGFPGSRLDTAFDTVRRATPADGGLCLLPAYGQAPPRMETLTFVHGAASDAGDGLKARDRWILIRSGANAGWKENCLPLEKLRALNIIVPELPASLAGTLAGLAEECQATMEWTGAGIQELLAKAGQVQNFCAIVPASLFNPALLGTTHERVFLEKSAFDPVVSIRGDGPSEIVEALIAGLGEVLGPASISAVGEQPKTETEQETLSLKHCRSFLALYDEGNVRRAAQRLCIVQPALTVQLHRIEEQVGLPLFSRSYHGLRANADADRLCALVRPLMAEFNVDSRELRVPAVHASGRVRVGLMPALDDESLTAQSFAAALDKWSAHYSDSDLQVVEAYSSTLLRWLSDGKIDFALTDRALADSSLAFETLAEDTMAVVIDNSSTMLKPGPVDLETLSRLPLVLPSSRHGLRTLLSQHLREKGLSLRPRIEVDSMAAALSLVKIARYATILPMGSVYKSHERRRLSVHEIQEPRIIRRICLARLRNASLGPAAERFIAELRSAFAARNQGDAFALPPPLAGVVELPRAS